MGSPETQKLVNNVVIIGSGPAGYTAAIYTSRANLRPMMFTGDQRGGQLITTTEVENFPGFPEGITGPQLMDHMAKQAERFGTTILNQLVERVDLHSRPFKIFSNGVEHQAHSVIVATGATARLLDIPSEKKLWGAGVSACATCDGFFYKNKDVAVVGGGDTAMEEATFLTRFCRSVTLIHRREEFRASKIMVEKAKTNPKIRFELNQAVAEILGEREKGGVVGVRTRNLKTGATKEIPITGIFMAIGHKPNSDLFKGFLEIDETGYIHTTPGTTRTAIEGVHACGDVQDHYYRQAITAAGTGCMAAIEVERWLSEKGLGG